MAYLKGTQAACEDYNKHVAKERNLPAGTITKWAHVFEGEGNYYIRKHPDYAPTSGLIEAELPKDWQNEKEP